MGCEDRQVNTSDNMVYFKDFLQEYLGHIRNFLTVMLK